VTESVDVVGAGDTGWGDTPPSLDRKTVTQPASRRFGQGRPARRLGVALKSALGSRCAGEGL